jgi:hypothetical protein
MLQVLIQLQVLIVHGNINCRLQGITLACFPFTGVPLYPEDTILGISEYMLVPAQTTRRTICTVVTVQYGKLLKIVQPCATSPLSVRCSPILISMVK